MDPTKPDTPIDCESYFEVNECAYIALFVCMLADGFFFRYFISKHIMRDLDFTSFCFFLCRLITVIFLIWALTVESNHKNEPSMRLLIILFAIFEILYILYKLIISKFTLTRILAIRRCTNLCRYFQECLLPLFFYLFNRERPQTRANDEDENGVNQILPDELLRTVPPPPFFRINSSGNPTTRLECGCKPRTDIHRRNCQLAGSHVIDMEDCLSIPLEASKVKNPGRTQSLNDVNQMAYSGIHALPRNPQRPQTIEMIDLLDLDNY